MQGKVKICSADKRNKRREKNQAVQRNVWVIRNKLDE